MRCLHCGTPFHPTAHRPDFCCAGCQFVHDLIAKSGLGQFYDLQESGVPPVPSLVFQKRDYTWLDELAHTSDGTLTLDVQGLSCLACAWLIERLFTRQPGALSIRVDPTLGLLTLRWQPGVFDPIGFARELQSFGYLVGPPDHSASTSDRGLNIRLGLCAALAMNAMLFTFPRYFGMRADFEFAPLFHRLELLIGTLSVVIGGSYFFFRSWRSLRQRVLHIDLPISLGLIAAYLGSVVAWTRAAHDFVYFDFVATFTFLMLAGRWLQQKAIARNRRQLLSMQAAPPSARDVATGEKLDAATIVTGAVFAVDSGQTVPVRSRLNSDAATLGLEWISGESESVAARRGRIVSAGALNCSQTAIELEALEPWSESLLAKLLRITPGATPRHPALERFLRAYVVAVVAIAALGFAGWWAATGALLPALQVLISVLVVSCPCASGVALPLASDLAASRLRHLGVFIRNSDLWARLDHVRSVIFDKTGTLTLETISLRHPEELHQLTEEQRRVLLALVHESLHPVSGCLREQLLADGVPFLRGVAVRETVGFGLECMMDGVPWRLGRPEWAGPGSTRAPRVGRGASPRRTLPSSFRRDAETNTRGACAPQTPSDTVFSRDGELVAAFHFGEEARADAAGEVRALESSGHRVFILSGDRRAKVERMADHLGLPREQCHAEMSPEEKAAWIARLDNRDTLYLGDGANDSLAFDAAWCSGTPAIDRGLLEQKADFYFLSRGLGGVRALLATAAMRRRVVRAVVGFGIAYNLGAIALSLAGMMSPLLAAVLMPASSLVSLGIVVLGLSRPSAFRFIPRSARRA